MPKSPRKKRTVVDTFDFQPGRVLARKYEITSKLGGGWEGEVYKIRELNTDIERAAKIFFPHRNLKNRSSDIYARKLHKLRECPIVIKYHTQETITYQRLPITVLISEYVDGELLADYIARLPRQRLPTFQGIHLLHALISGIENIHFFGEYHGDLHAENIVVRRLGLSFELKLLDLFHWGRATRENRNDDICDAVRVFYDAIGGRTHYSKQPKEIKYICCGLKRSLILQRFKTASALRVYLETQTWT
ncbi:MAG TPA: serine/threonine protein kinase [Nitrospirales bacterium]|nr:serine/threonine protein kinase [Nitrospirales bacterium]HIB55199.1 serine/threonine protein kinase [Nitrospirales bacterium]HIC04175.1 serine/threonine protein kinase [Nitrospirales bacterium]HIN32358.1 serine/threonine protein kinase [Nitrospirales bacterium]HIO21558.1 serine/threonine protein kinase [Nitrospirales bacterium]